MTSRERVLMALAYEEPDRVPIDFAAWRSSGIQAPAYAALRRHLGLNQDKPFKLYDLMQQLAEPELELIQRFHGDVVQIHRLEPSFGIRIDAWKPSFVVPPSGGLQTRRKRVRSPGFSHSLAETECLVPRDYNPVPRAGGGWSLFAPDGTEVARMLSSGGYFEPVNFPLANARTPEDIEAIPWPVMTAEEAAFIRAQAEHWRRTSDFATLACFGGNILENGNFMFGFAEFMMRLAADRELVECFFDRLVRWHIANLEVFLPAVEGLVDIVAVGDDLGTQTSLIVSPTTYRQLVKPRQARVYDYIRRHSSARLFLHSCGAIEPILGDLIEIGVQIINPVQIGAAGMEPAKLKRKYGRHLTFWGGGCDTQHTLPHGTVADVEAEVRRLVETFKPGGGFVFTQVHNILANVPPEKIVTLYDTAYAAGGYG